MHASLNLTDAAAFIIYHGLVTCGWMFPNILCGTNSPARSRPWVVPQSSSIKARRQQMRSFRTVGEPSILEEGTSKPIDTNQSSSCTNYYTVTPYPLHCTARYVRAMSRRMGPPVRGFYRELDAARPDTQLVFANDASPAVNPCEYRCVQPRDNHNPYSPSISGADTGPAHSTGSDSCGLRGLS